MEPESGASAQHSEETTLAERLGLLEARYDALVSLFADTAWISGASRSADRGVAWWEAITGQLEHESVGWGWLDVVHPDDRAVARESWERAQRDATRYDVRYRLLRRDGTYGIFAARGVPLLDSDGSVREWVGALTDITEREAAARAAAALDERLQRALNAIEGFVYEYDFATGHVSRSHGFERVIGYLPNQVPPTAEWWRAQIHPDDRDSVIEAGNMGMDGDDTFELHYRVQHRDGHYIYIWDRSVMIRDAAGAPVQVTGSSINVTAQKRVEIELAASEARYRQIIETAHEGIWAIDNDGKTTFVNRRMAAMLGTTDAAMHQSESLDYVFPDDRSFARKRADMRSHGRTEQFEIRLLHRSGEPIWVQIANSSLLDADGRMIGILGMVTDITKRKRIEAERSELFLAEQRALAEARSAVALRDTFLSVAAHELKNPLTAMLGNAQLLQRRLLDSSRVTDRERRMSSVIVEQNLRLYKLIIALLDISRLDHGVLTLDRQPFDIVELVRRSIDEFKVTIDTHAINFDSGVERAVIVGDALRIEQVIGNLLANAAKYSPESAPIDVRLTEGADSVSIAVIDRGIGIPEDALPKLFTRFFRAANVKLYAVGGMGIGLSIVKELVELHGGSVIVASVEGAGSTFTLTLPRSGGEAG